MQVVTVLISVRWWAKDVFSFIRLAPVLVLTGKDVRYHYVISDGSCMVRFVSLRMDLQVHVTVDKTQI